MDYNIEIVGFHGTSKEYADNILSTKTYTYNRRNNHWLGNGIYFFREDSDQAMSWAREQVKFGEKAVVLRNIIDVNSKSFLNLDTRSGTYKFKRFLNTVEDQVKTYSMEINIDEEEDVNNVLRCFILDLLPESIEVIQNSFEIPTQPKYITNLTLPFNKIDIEVLSVQICVRKNENIRKDSIIKFAEEEKSLPKRRRNKGRKKRTYNINYKTN